MKAITENLLDKTISIELEAYSLYQEAMELYSSNSFLAAEKIIKQILDLDINDMSLRFLCFYYFAQIKKIEENNNLYLQYIQLAEKSLLAIPNRSRLDTYRLASLYRVNNDLQKAVGLFEEIISVVPLDDITAKAYFQLGEINFLERHFKEASTQFERCISLMPSHKKACEYLVEISKRKG